MLVSIDWLLKVPTICHRIRETHSSTLTPHTPHTESLSYTRKRKTEDREHKTEVKNKTETILMQKRSTGSIINDERKNLNKKYTFRVQSL